MIRHLLLACSLFSLLCFGDTDIKPPAGWDMQDEPSRLVLSPQRTPSGKTVRIELYDPETSSGDLPEWFRGRLEQMSISATECRLKGKGDSIHCVTNKRGRDDYYYGLRLSDGRHRFVHMVLAPSTLATAGYIGACARILKDAQAGLGRSTPSVRAPAPQQSPAPPAPSAATSYQPPIKAVYLHLEYGFTGVGGSMVATYEPYVLLQDGTVTDDLSYFPRSAADIEQWRARKPRAWGVWTENGSRLAIRWNDPRRKPDQWEKWFVARPGEDGMPLSGFYRTLGGGGNTALGGNVSIAAWKNFEFSPDGSVTTGGGSGGYTDGPGTSVATSHKQAELRARYHIDGHAIHLTYADGRSETRWFYRFPDSDNAIGIGSSTYSRKR